MNFSVMSDEEILVELGRRMDLRRREKEMGDKELVLKSGTNLSTIKRFRSNQGSISLNSFIRILRGLGKLDALSSLLESTQSFSPAKQIGKPLKKRIYKKRPKSTSFTWGDEE